MNKVEYIGEHLWLGSLGHFLILLGFVSAIFCAYAYFQSVRQKDESWKALARKAFIVHGASYLIVIGILFYAMINEMYEYIYVYRTVTDGQELKFLLAAFWEDQEGSFMLWMFWHIVLGAVLLFRKDQWEAHVICVLALIQAFISSMLLGIYVPFVESDIKIGSNPFSLIRDIFEGPIFANADYLSLVKGTGLNPLLQNYWMTIHPPVLFLGFASLSIPFCYAIAGLTSKNHKEIIQPILKWSLFASFIYGLGILMGGAWAYEALTFGGYWAWDPVENTSLVPWLILVAGVHTNLIAKNTGHAFRSTYIYYMLAFLMVLYSTFLTRSGVLGDTSVHAFTTMGLESQLILFISFFIILGIGSFIYGRKSIPSIEKEESIQSREFWMFIGALVLSFSGLLMTVSTSLPVFNKIMELFDPNYIGKVIADQMAHHNRFQIWIGIFIGLLGGVSILLRYKAFNWGEYRMRFIKDISLSLGLTTVISFLLSLSISINHWSQYLFLFAGVFVVSSNGIYLSRFVKSNLKQAGAVLSHFGFGMLLLGIMFSGLNKQNVSSNPFVQADFVDDESVNRAVVLIKGEPFFTKNYWLNYVGDTLIGNLRNYEINFKKVNEKNEILDEFTTYPSALYSSDFTKIEALNPGNERKLVYDVFTAAAPPQHMQDIEIAKSVEDSLNYLVYTTTEGEEFEADNYIIKVGEFVLNKEFSDSDHSSNSDYDLSFSLPMTIKSKSTDKEYQVNPGLGVKESLIFQFPEVIDELGIKIKIPESEFSKIFEEDAGLSYEEFTLKEGEETNVEGIKIKLNGFNRQPQSLGYVPQEGDIALGGLLSLKVGDGKDLNAEPIFILRGNQQLSVKAYLPNEGIHIRFTKINPVNEEMSFHLARENRDFPGVQFMIAEDVPRSDILIVESNIFPGINLVWGGCLCMLFGLLLSYYVKRSAEES